MCSPPRIGRWRLFSGKLAKRRANCVIVAGMDLLIDIGGTNIRAAAAQNGRMTAVRHYRTASYKTAGEIVADVLRDEGLTSVTRVFLAVAGPVTDGRAALTNADLTVDAGALTREFGLAGAAVLNDLEALAYILADTAGLDASLLTPASPAPGKTAIVIAPGTGLGLGAYLVKDGRASVLSTQGGHVRAAPSTPREFALCAALSHDDNYLCAEDLLSGPGIERIYAGLHALDGEAPPLPAPNGKEIVERAQIGADARAKETVEIYLSMLGSYCGDMALVFLSYGGVYLAGNIINGLTPMLADSKLASSFLNKGLMAPLMGEIAFAHVPLEEPALEGLKAFAAQQS